MHPTVNRAIGEILEKKIIRSVSLMPTGVFFEDAVERLRGLNIGQVGVHLALSSEYPALPLRPVLSQKDTPSLHVQENRFASDFHALSDSVDCGDVRRELLAQIQKVQNAGLTVSHIDGHMFFYLPEEGGQRVFDQVCDIGKSLGVPVRGASEPHFPEASMIWNDHDSEVDRFAFYRNFLGTRGNTNLELIIHPADSLAELRAFTASGHRRLADFHFFAGEDFSQSLVANNIKVHAWSDRFEE